MILGYSDEVIGKISEFGGPNDSGMAYDEGLAFYEHSEADLHPDLFLPRSKDLAQGVSKRLRTDAYYIAINVEPAPRHIIQNSLWGVQFNSLTVIGRLVDRGPSAYGRLIDASPAILKFLGCKTDDLVEVSEITSFNLKFGLHELYRPGKS